MKNNEFLFVIRIASILYDPFVIENLKLTELRDAMSDGQIYSKLWLIEALNDIVDLNSKKFNIAILGGWIGTLAYLFFTKKYSVSITSIDIDERVNKIAQKLNYDEDFKTQTLDMYDADYSLFDIIINTSSEHISNINQWRNSLPKNKILVVQNNNFVNGKGHISTVNHVDELRQYLSLSKIYFSGTKKFKLYDRYMIIGVT